MVEIKGLEKFGPKDFPGYISSTIFVGGCNFRCPYCHNSELVLRADRVPSFPLDYFLSFLDSRKGWLEGICVTGGEPLLHEDLEVLLSIIKDRGLLVKIDTNGSFPLRLEKLIDKGLVDRVAMDIKNSWEKYERTVGVKVKISEIKKSIDVIKNSGLDYIFRTTAVPGLVEEEDIRKISLMLNGSKTFQIQQFSPNNTLDELYRQRKPYSNQEIEAMVKIARAYFEQVRVEGI
ncbi:MAG: anaerobic ribonucleoside-triphosphate reductase activating protein [Candidatus Aminicenantales bacterium]